MSKKKGLGRGLSALIPEGGVTAELVQENGIREIAVSRLEPNPHQPRREFVEESLEELRQSISEHGVIQPLVVVENEDTYLIVAGERRYRAAKLAGLASVPCIVREYTRGEIVEIALVENLQREDLSPVEEALAYKQLADEFHLTQQQISGKVGKSRSYVANMMRLLSLPVSLLKLLSSGEVSVGHARAVLGLADEKLMIEVAQQIVAKNLNVRQTEKLVQRLLETKNVSRETSQKRHVENLILREFEDDLKHKLGTHVRIVHGKKKGRIEIEYYSEEELERLMSFLGGKK